MKEAQQPASTSHILRFGVFELDSRSGELRKHGIRIRLQEQPFQILTMLLEEAGAVVLREDIRKRLWPNGTIVEFDPSINAAVQRLRDALGDSADTPRYVETVARRGYRFIGELKAAPAVQSHPPAAGPAIEAVSPASAEPDREKADRHRSNSHRGTQAAPMGDGDCRNGVVGFSGGYRMAVMDGRNPGQELDIPAGGS